MAVLLAVSIALLLFICVDFVKERVARSARFQVRPVQVALEGTRPAHAPRLESVLRSGPPPVDRPRSILDPKLPRIVRERLLRRPWIRSVGEMTRRFPDGLSVAVEIRRPQAVVRAGRERLLVDGDGVVLASDTRLGPPRLPWVRTPGDPLTLVPRDGGAFPARSPVREALGVLADLEGVGDHGALDTLRIDAVVVGMAGRRREPGASDIHLVCDTGLVILWGRSPLSPLSDIEHPPRTKLDHLARVHRLHRGFIGISLVDLRFEEPEFER